MEKIVVSDLEFQQAIDLLDSGNIAELRNWVDAKPKLLTDKAFSEESADGYFAEAKLLWFVAENPIRNGTLPDNIVDVTRTLVGLAKKYRVEDLSDQLNKTLVLVASGRIARETGQQQPLAKFLVEAGADPNAGLRAAMAHGELEICQFLLQCGAQLNLSLAAALGREDEVNVLKRDANKEQMQEALTMAAINGQARSVSILLDNGADPNLFNPVGAHAHSTPLHQAINKGFLATVCALVTRGADMSIKDKLFAGDARGWAIHAGHKDILTFLDDAEVMMPAVHAIKTGAVETLQQWLTQHSHRINDIVGDDPRTLLHYATDWPGKQPRVAETIAALVNAGANVNAKFIGPSTTATETPLHWAASCDNLEAAEALIKAGAELDITGGCIANGTPLVLAVIFKHWRVAQKLLEEGAMFSLPLVAGMGRMDLVKTFFDEDGHFHNPYGSMPNYDSVSNAQQELDFAIWHAVISARLEVINLLIERGANVNMRSPLSTTPLDDAINNGHTALAEQLRSVGAKRFTEL